LKFKRNGDIENFAEVIINIFKPLFLATLERDKYKYIAKFMDNLVGIDLIGDEAIDSNHNMRDDIDPKDWNFNVEPS
jgi:hypothetical protein